MLIQVYLEILRHPIVLFRYKSNDSVNGPVLADTFAPIRRVFFILVDVMNNIIEQK